MDDLDEDLYSSDGSYRTILRNVLTVSIIIFILMSFVGNIFVVYRIVRNPQLRKKHFLFLNLSVGDLLATFTTKVYAVIMIRIDNNWLAGNVLCKANVFVQILTEVGSFYAVLAIIVHQFRVLVKPSWSCSSTMVLSLGTWILALLAAAPHLYTASQVELMNNRYICVYFGSFDYTLSSYVIYYSLFLSYSYYLPIIGGGIMYAVIFLREKPLSSLVVSSNKFKMLMLSLALYGAAVITAIPFCVEHSVYMFSKLERSSYLLNTLLYLLFISRNSINPYIYIIFHFKEIFSRRAEEQNSPIPLVQAPAHNTASTRVKHESPNDSTEADDLIRLNR